MRAKLSFVAAAALGLPGAAHAVTYLTVPQAQAAMEPGASLKPEFVTLSDAQVAAIQRDSGVHVLSRQLRAWRTSSGGWFIVDEVVGKHEFITYALAIDAKGAVKDVQILDYKESYGDQVRLPAWRAQFDGKTHASPLQLGRDIKNIAGATLSSKHITDGVKRLLTTYALVLAPQPA